MVKDDIVEDLLERMARHGKCVLFPSQKDKRKLEKGVVEALRAGCEFTEEQRAYIANRSQMLPYRGGLTILAATTSIANGRRERV